MVTVLDVCSELEKEMQFEELSNEEWSLVAPTLCAPPPAGMLKRGRPRIRPRLLANAVLWVLTTGESWAKLPAHYPSQPTCRCRFEEWRRDGKLAEMIRILSDRGRRFSYVPDVPNPVPKARPKRDSRVIDERGLPRVVWRSQASWQTSTADPGRRFAPAAPAEPIEPIEPIESGRPATAAAAREPQPDTSNRGFWMGLAAKGARVTDDRGYIVYVAADLVPDAMFRGWTEITRDGRRVARSGLVGPKFGAPEAAMQCALTWARRWIEQHGVCFEFELLHRAAD
ncbi:transposase [Paraburkholderia phymatum]|uniref:Putative transposase A-like protein n=1 Tax=Paraburkholderia phymatum (strain DSM 17167 / CIP 108236 / LMG 21445 / STM815) TaxID=391038 RepID=B2JUL3_PARP8|nr:transposase [Paraburkholderia phymatum]ACC76184.1 putative transposase A-like protein [Paraburkholderia phymatum STM815]